MKNKIGQSAKLQRSLNLPLLVFYGLGTTIGAGIYVLVGAAAGHAGIFAPVAFIAAAIGLIPTTMSYAELAGRWPVSAGEAAYVRHGLNSRTLAMITGWMVILSGIVASATIAIGCAGYLIRFINVPLPFLIIGVILIMGLIALWGIMESVLLAALFTLIEAGGLIFLIVVGFASDLVSIDRIPEIIPPFNDTMILMGIVNAGMLAVFAFIGFEDIVNVAEETKQPRKTLPRAIFLTLGITALLYTLVTIVAVLSVPPDELAQSKAPLSLVFQTLTGSSPLVISVIAIFATANTILVQFIMVSRVVYGMSEQGNMPSIFKKINRVTKTPVLATLIVMAITALLALAFPLERLAEWTSQVILTIWILINMSLVRVKWKKEPPPENGFIAPMWVPIVGVIFCAGMVLLSLII